MIGRPRIVDVYETADDSVPFDDYMRGLKDLAGKAAIESRIGLLRRGSLGKKYRDIGDGLIELKIESGYRIYLSDNGTNSLILFAGAKRTQKQDIKTSKKYWADYKARG